jgi:hypothetical protein
LQEITNEKATGVHAVTRRNVAKGTIQEWENVRAGQQDFVRINWHFLKDYKERVRKLNNTGAKRSDGKAWWQFWK